jgi:hypothetical protein
MNEEAVSPGASEKPVENPGSETPVDPTVAIINAFPEWAKGWMQAISHWVVSHQSSPPIFLNPITGKPEWINRAKRRKYERHVKKA